MRDENGPLNLEEEDELEGEGGLEGVERRWLEGVSENVRAGYVRSKGTFGYLMLYGISEADVFVLYILF